MNMPAARVTPRFLVDEPLDVRMCQCTILLAGFYAGVRKMAEGIPLLAKEVLGGDRGREEARGPLEGWQDAARPCSAPPPRRSNGVRHGAARRTKGASGPKGGDKPPGGPCHSPRESSQTPDSRRLTPLRFRATDEQKSQCAHRRA
jgi:hypothetical protein